MPWYLTDLDPTTYLDEASWLTLDFETTNLEKGSPLVKDNLVVLACTAAGTGDAPYTEAHDKWMGGDAARFPSLRNAVRVAKILVAHNAKFELQWLRRLGIDTSHLLVCDTMLAEYVLAGNRRWELNLDAVARRYGFAGKERVIDALMKGGVCPSTMPREWLVGRVTRDVETTRELARRQLAELQRLGLLGVFFTRCITATVLADIEMQGMTLDPERVKKTYVDTLYKLAEAERELSEMSGGINLRSTKQLAEFLYDGLGFQELKRRNGEPSRTASGKRLTDSDTLEKLKATTKEQKRFVKIRKEWGKLNAAITKALAFFQHVCDEDNGILYGRYNQTVTQTHRLSSSGRRRVFSDGFEGGCQFQNLPNDYKKLFRASESHFGPNTVIFEADGSGIEFRVAGGLADDQQATRDIESDADIHRYTASIIYNKPEAEITKEQRREAKPDTFKPLYGGQSGTPRQQAYYEAFKAKYHQIADMQKGWVREVLKDKELVLPWGMRFYWPHAKMRADGYVPETPQIFNYPIQCLATAEIVPVALVYLYWRIKTTGVRARLINTVHDSAIAEVHIDDVQEYREIAITAFLDDVYRYLDRVYDVQWTTPPLGVGTNVATHWGMGEEQKFSRKSPFSP